MRGSDRRSDVVTTDLLFAWTDPDTAIEAVGTRLGILGERISELRTASAESPLRKALSDLLFDLVDHGVLEKRPCGNGRYAFRWRDELTLSAIAVDAEQARRERCAERSRRAVPIPAPRVDPPIVPAPVAIPEPAIAVSTDIALAPTSTSTSTSTSAPPPPAATATPPPISATATPRRSPGVVAQMAPLFFPTVSCILVILAFVWLGHAVAVVVAFALALAGVVGLVRRVPFAGFWTFGLVLAGLLVHFS